MRRRQYVQLTTAGLLGSLAGCIGDDTDAGDDTTTGDDTDAGDDTTTGDDSPDDATVGDDGDDTEVPADDDVDTGDDEEEAHDDDGGEETGQTFGETFTFHDSYAMEMEFTDPETGQSGWFEARHRDGNIHQHWEIDGMSDVWEMYHIDGDSYMVMGEMCFLNPDTDDEPDLEYRDEDFDEVAEPTLEPQGTTTIDNIDVYIYEVSDPSTGEEMTYYVDSSTGYLRRIEWSFGVMDLHSWGDVEPISAPEMDCQSFGGGAGSDY